MPSTLSFPSSSAPSATDANNAQASAAVTMNPSSMPSPFSFPNCSAPSATDANDAQTSAAVTMNPASSASKIKSCASVWQVTTITLALVPILSGMFVLVD